jgi:hypothetical protein
MATPAGNLMSGERFLQNSRIAFDCVSFRAAVFMLAYLVFWQHQISRKNKL